MNWRLWQRAKKSLSAADRVSSQGYRHDWVGFGSERRCRRCYEREDGSLCQGRPAPIVIDAQAARSSAR